MGSPGNLPTHSGPCLELSWSSRHFYAGLIDAPGIPWILKNRVNPWRASSWMSNPGGLPEGHGDSCRTEHPFNITDIYLHKTSYPVLRYLGARNVQQHVSFSAVSGFVNKKTACDCVGWQGSSGDHAVPLHRLCPSAAALLDLQPQGHSLHISPKAARLALRMQQHAAGGLVALPYLLIGSQ